MNILFIAPLPPPITGHSVVSQVVLNHLVRGYNIEVINLSIGSLHDGAFTFKRALIVFALIFKVFVAARRADKVYLTISESVAGNIKDLFFYFAIRRLLHCSVIHLHGGSFKQVVLNRSILLHKVNQYFLSRVGSVILSGSSHLNIFNSLTPVDRINIIPNFAMDNMFVEPNAIERKFRYHSNILRILYVSGMTPGKGYQILLDAYERLSDFSKSYVQLDFAGKFDDKNLENLFIERIASLPMVNYHGVVEDDVKADLFAASHFFILPTNFMEGQPISILEAYASGCVVLTTPRPGILDIFEDSVNGFIISSENSTSLSNIIDSYCRDVASLAHIAFYNHKIAHENYRQSIFCERLEKVLVSVNS